VVTHPRPRFGALGAKFSESRLLFGKPVAYADNDKPAYLADTRVRMTNPSTSITSGLVAASVPHVLPPIPVADQTGAAAVPSPIIGYPLSDFICHSTFDLRDSHPLSPRLVAAHTLGRP
jgi:hypothetical protein